MSFLQLPNEVRLEIAEWVAFPERNPVDKELIATRHVLSFRLTCKDFNELALTAIVRLTRRGFHTAFETAHLSLSQESLDIVSRLTNHSHLRQAVKVLTTSFKQLDLMFVSRERFAAMTPILNLRDQVTIGEEEYKTLRASLRPSEFNIDFPESPSRFIPTLQRYEEMIVRQRQLLEQMLAYTLPNALKVMPNIEILHLRRPYDHALEAFQQGYAHVSGQFIALCRILHCVAKAGIRITSIKFADADAVFWGAYHMPPNIGGVLGLLHFVTYMHMNVRSATYGLLDGKNWGKMLSTSPGLQRLVLIWEDADEDYYATEALGPEVLMKMILDKKHWPHLHTIKFRGFIFEPTQLSEFLIRHTESLRKLHLGNFHLEPTKWHHFFSITRGMLALDEARLENPTERFDGCNVGDLIAQCASDSVGIDGGLESGSTECGWVDFARLLTEPTLLHLALAALQRAGG
ncbi:MAG: hypothetical protein ACRYG8_11100 [Janthinobacterium lividum]